MLATYFSFHSAASCYTHYVTHFMLHTLCYAPYVTHFMLHTSCYALHVTHFMLHVIHSVCDVTDPQNRWEPSVGVYPRCGKQSAEVRDWSASFISLIQFRKNILWLISFMWWDKSQSHFYYLKCRTAGRWGTQTHKHTNSGQKHHFITATWDICHCAISRGDIFNSFAVAAHQSL